MEVHLYNKKTNKQKNMQPWFPFKQLNLARSMLPDKEGGRTK